MSFETISLLLNWLEMGALLAILFRLSSTFHLIASTQHQLRRAIHHLGEQRAAELGVHNPFDDSGIELVSRSPQARGETGSTVRSKDLAPLSP
jgi:hypothetical protein